MTRRVEEEVASFLARWSRRKAAARRGTPEPEPEPAEAASEPLGRTLGASPDERATSEAPAEADSAGRGEAAIELDLAKLPDPDTLDAASDFSVFMRPGVPAELKRRALRRLWKVNPIVSTPDGLDDYYVVNDFSDASTVVADLKTLYRVGQGMMAAFEEEREGVAAGREPAAASAAGSASQGAGDGARTALEEKTGEADATDPAAASGASTEVATGAGSARAEAGGRPLAADPARS